LRKHIVTGCPEQYTTQKAIAKVKEIKEIREKVKVKLEEPVETNTCKKRVRNDSFDGTMIKKEKVELFDLYEGWIFFHFFILFYSIFFSFLTFSPFFSTKIF